MTPLHCPYERTVVDALTAGTWPDRCDRGLVQHVEACDGCSDVLDVARTLLAARAEDMAHVRVPSADAMWWRMQLRARRDMQGRALRPLWWCSASALAVVAGLLAALVTLTGTWLQRWMWQQVVDSPLARGADGLRESLVGFSLPMLIVACVAVMLPLIAIPILIDRE